MATAELAREETTGRQVDTLINQYGAVRVSFTWWGVTKGLNDEQKESAAEAFGADAGWIGGSKRLIDTKSDVYQAVVEVRGRIGKFWKAITLPYIEPGKRLIKLDTIAAFDQEMGSLRDQLADAVMRLDVAFDRLRSDAQRRLGNLFNHADYPSSIAGAFAVAWDYPPIDPPSYLAFLDPNVHEREMRRFRERLAETAQLAEAEFIRQFNDAM